MLGEKCDHTELRSALYVLVLLGFVMHQRRTQDHNDVIFPTSLTGRERLVTVPSARALAVFGSANGSVVGSENFGEVRESIRRGETLVLDLGKFEVAASTDGDDTITSLGMTVSRFLRRQRKDLDRHHTPAAGHPLRVRWLVGGAHGERKDLAG